MCLIDTVVLEAVGVADRRHDPAFEMSDFVLTVRLYSLQNGLHETAEMMTHSQETWKQQPSAQLS